jgi:sporadic carbohydrate cluster protein (TIGR04323 family)
LTSNSRFIGYVTVRAFSGFRMPVPVQNMVLRNYAQTQNMPYALPQTEHKYHGSYMQLFTTLRDALHGDHVGMCGTGMLPPPGALRDRAFAIVREKSLTLHFVFDRMVMSGQDDFDRLRRNETIMNEVQRARGHAIAAEIREYLDQRLR